jgi:hypothetical protein
MADMQLSSRELRKFHYSNCVIDRTFSEILKHKECSNLSYNGKRLQWLAWKLGFTKEFCRTWYQTTWRLDIARRKLEKVFMSQPGYYHHLVSWKTKLSYSTR